MKLFRIPDKRTEGQCNAMRCTKTEGLTSGWKHPEEIDPVTLCERHANELKAYIAATQDNDNVQMNVGGEQINTNISTEKPTDVTRETIKKRDADREQNLSQPHSLENILTKNLAIESGAIESRQETAEKINSIAVAIKVVDKDTRDKADQLAALVHAEEKAIKAEINAMYRPVKDAAKATKERLDSWFGPTLNFYSEAKVILKEKLSTFLNAERERENKALEEGKVEVAKECVTDKSENVRTTVKREYAIKNNGINLPTQFLVPDETKNDDIVKLLPRELLRPNYDLINTVVQEHGKRVNIPDVEVIEYEDVQMKGVRTKK